MDDRFNHYNLNYKTLIELLPPETTGIVMKLSGGADSSILYYTLCKEMQEANLNIPIYAATLDAQGKDWYSHYAKKVIKFTKERTGIEPKEHLIRYLPGPWGDTDYTNAQDEVSYSFIDNGKANVIIGGLTTNPPIKEMSDAASHVKGIKYDNYVDLYNRCADRDRRRDNNHDKWFSDWGPTPNGTDFYAILPFLLKDKRSGTFALYEKMNVLYDLFPLTYSCEEFDPTLKKLVKVVDKYYELSHCGLCWFCCERAYGFGRL